MPVQWISFSQHTLAPYSVMHFPFGASLQIHQNSSPFPSIISSHQVRHSRLCVNLSCHCSFTFKLYMLDFAFVQQKVGSLCQKKMSFVNFVLWIKNQIIYTLIFSSYHLRSLYRFSFPTQSCECRANIFLSFQTLGSLVKCLFFFF